MAGNKLKRISGALQDVPPYARDLPAVFQDNPYVWDKLAPHFEGYAVGGRVEADRCFCKHPMSVKRAA